MFIKSPYTKTKLTYEINLTQFVPGYCDQLNVKYYSSDRIIFQPGVI